METVEYRDKLNNDPLYTINDSVLLPKRYFWNVITGEEIDEDGEMEFFVTGVSFDFEEDCYRYSVMGKYQVLIPDEEVAFLPVLDNVEENQIIKQAHS